jgi:hypothetical protein
MIGALGLLYMARGLAWGRGWGTKGHPARWAPAPREIAELAPASREYYAILDRISKGTKP